MKWRRTIITYLIISPLIYILIGYVFYPLFSTFVASVMHDGAFSLEKYRQFFDLKNFSNLKALFTSIYISVLSVIFSGIVGVLLAFLLSRYEFPGRKILSSLAVLPMALPPLVGVYAFVFLFSESGIIPRALKELFGLAAVPFKLRGIPGVLVVHTFTMYVYFYLMASTAFSALDPSLEEAAYNLGANRFTVWRKVILPMLTPALVAASLLVFMVSMASYTAPLIFGVERTLTMQIYISRTNGDLAMAATQSTLLSMVSISFLIFMRWYQSRRIYRSVSKGVVTQRTELKNPVVRYVAGITAIILVFILLLPILTLVLVSFSVDYAWTVQILPPKYTLANYAKLFSNPRTWEPIKNSLVMSGIATAANIIFGIAAAYAIVRMYFKGKNLMDILIMLPWALPGTVIGINLITAFNRPTLFTANNILVGTFWIMPLAYFVRHIPLVYRSTSAALMQLDPNIEEAALNLGATWGYTFRRVVLPLISPGIISGALLAFVQGIGEFVASILLYTPSSRPISVAIYEHMYRFEFGTASAYGVLQVLLIIIVLLVTGQFSEKASQSAI